ncbi:hypothetical protein WJX77_005194 [Trebouxia sp. C0004]
MNAFTELINARSQSLAASPNLPSSFTLNSFFYANLAEDLTTLASIMTRYRAGSATAECRAQAPPRASIYYTLI